jgi:hypothetical protein
LNKFQIQLAFDPMQQPNHLPQKPGCKLTELVAENSSDSGPITAIDLAATGPKYDVCPHDSNAARANNFDELGAAVIDLINRRIGPARVKSGPIRT